MCDLSKIVGGSDFGRGMYERGLTVVNKENNGAIEENVLVLV